MSKSTSNYFILNHCEVLEHHVVPEIKSSDPTCKAYWYSSPLNCSLVNIYLYIYMIYHFMPIFWTDILPISVCNFFFTCFLSKTVLCKCIYVFLSLLGTSVFENERKSFCWTKIFCSKIFWFHWSSSTRIQLKIMKTGNCLLDFIQNSKWSLCEAVDCLRGTYLLVFIPCLQ